MSVHDQNRVVNKNFSYLMMDTPNFEEPFL